MLIIEDEPIIAMDIETIVRDLGHNVTGVAVTRDEAVSQARQNPPGLVLADIQLADDSSGIDAVKDILAEFSVPVIFITAFPERLLTGTRPEPTFLITKPFQRSTVKAAIAQALFFDAATVPAARRRNTAPPRRVGRLNSDFVTEAKWPIRDVPILRSTRPRPRRARVRPRGVTRYVLIIGTLLVVIIFAIIVLVGRP